MARAINDVAYMREAVFFEGERRGRQLSRFWILLILASTIAAAGVVADSTATVIGAMIVAPLMIPIQGTMLAVILTDRRNLLRSFGILVAGSASAVGVGYLIAVFVVAPVVASNNAQVAARVEPRLIDLVAALATGVVGAVALVRSDISDTLPGVAIAISLVPPLSVVGITIEAGAWDEAAGALLLFATNVAAILLTGIIVMAVYRVYRRVDTSDPSRHTARHRRAAVAVIVLFVVIVAVPLTITSISISQNEMRQSDVQSIADTWAERQDWEVLSVSTDSDGTVLSIAGLPPLPDTASLSAALQAGGIDPTTVRVQFVPTATLEPPP